jgi:hypothetical protein
LFELLLGLLGGRPNILDKCLEALLGFLALGVDRRRDVEPPVAFFEKIGQACPVRQPGVDAVSGRSSRSEKKGAIFDQGQFMKSCVVSGREPNIVNLLS